MAVSTASQPTPAHELPSSTKSATTAKSTIDTTTQNNGYSVPRGPVTANLVFYGGTADGSEPYNYVEEPPAGQPQNNLQTADHDVTISDARGHEGDFNIDTNAFAALSSVPSAMTRADFDDDARVAQKYYPEVERLLLDKVPGSHRILIFDHTIRRNTPGSKRTPVTRTHIDQTPKSAAARVRHHITDASEAEKLLQGRYRIINVWRPINGPVVAHPLAVADSATVSADDLVPVHHIYPDRTGETAAVKYGDHQRWWYWSGMQDDERLLLQCFDSKNGARVPHTAFVDPRTPEGAPGRESIEVRALVFG
ncbi:putative 7alpha-cephem-methoxylase P8 chain related protein [Phyllosticta paracitricarpa]|uniref:Methyltransferase n=1 Tax=Phyllosticta paracitricarpa TaxID=2016321 RepID=A0ABR1N7M0_9PEZI